MSARPRIIEVGEELPSQAPRAMRAARPAKQARAKGQAKANSARKLAGQRFHCLNGFVDSSIADLTRAELACWLILFRDVRGGLARTGRASLAKRAGCDESTVTRSLAKLAERGLIEFANRGGIGRGTNTYRVHATITEESGSK